MSYKLATARAIAEKIIADITPFCVRCDIAGSVRREKPEVKDIEIVCIPKFRDVPGPVDLFGEKKLVENVLQKHLEAKDTVRWIKPGTSVIEDWPLKPQAKYWRGLMPNGIKLDVFLATPDNYGMIYLLRTGSFEFNIALATHAKKIRRPIHEGRLWVDRVARDTPEEIDIFNWLGLEFVAPQQRLGELAIRKSAFAVKGGLHLVRDAAPVDWNAVAKASPFVMRNGITPEGVTLNADAGEASSLLATDYCLPSTSPGEMVDPRCGTVYPCEVREVTHFMCYVRFTGDVPLGGHREGWQSRKYLVE